MFILLYHVFYMMNRLANDQAVCFHISGLFTYTDTCLGTNYVYIYSICVSLIRIFSYPDSHLGNGGVWISEGPLYLPLYWWVCTTGYLPVLAFSSCWHLLPPWVWLCQLQVPEEQFTIAWFYISKKIHLTELYDNSLCVHIYKFVTL